MTITANEIHISLPEGLVITQPFVFLLYWCLGIFLVSVILKLANKAPHLRAGIVAALSILIMYVVCLLIYIHKPLGLQNYIAPLPFIRLEGESLTLGVYEIAEGGFVDIPRFCSQILSMFLLAFLVSQIYAYRPGNLKSPGWLVFRLFSTLFCIVIHYALCKVIQKILDKVPADGFLESALPYIPIGFIGFLLLAFTFGWAKIILKHFFKVVNPTYEGLSGFFFKNEFGKIVTRAMYSTLLLTLFAYGLQGEWEKAYQVPTIPINSLIGFPEIVKLIPLFLLWLIVGFLL